MDDELQAMKKGLNPGRASSSSKDRSLPEGRPIRWVVCPAALLYLTVLCLLLGSSTCHVKC